MYAYVLHSLSLEKILILHLRGDRVGDVECTLPVAPLLIHRDEFFLQTKNYFLQVVFHAFLCLCDIF